MKPNHTDKYSAFAPIPMTGRRWPNRTLERAPIWLSNDLRDDNQALIEPMSIKTKLAFFNRLVAIGFKEIELAFRPLRKLISISCAA